MLDARHLSEGRPPNVMRRCSRPHPRPALCRTVPGRIGCRDAEGIAERSHPARIADEHSFRGDREWGQEWGRRQGLRWPSTGVKMPTSGPGIPGRQGFSRASSPRQHCCGPGCRGFESPRSPHRNRRSGASPATAAGLSSGKLSDLGAEWEPILVVGSQKSASPAPVWRVSWLGWLRYRTTRLHQRTGGFR